MTYDYMIISRWRNRAEVEDLINKIRQKGKLVYSFFEGDGSNHSFKYLEEKSSPEEYMKDFENTPNWETNEEVRKIFQMDMMALKNSETIILLLPAGKSAHIEAGVAYGLGKKLVLIGKVEEVESLYLIFNVTYLTPDQFIESI